MPQSISGDALYIRIGVSLSITGSTKESWNDLQQMQDANKQSFEKVRREVHRLKKRLRDATEMIGAGKASGRSKA